MVIAMGSTCSACGQELSPDRLIIHHTNFDIGLPLGYLHPDRYKMLDEFRRLGKIPPNVELLCDDCNRKRHKYRPSFKTIFGNRLKSQYISLRTHPTRLSLLHGRC
jgi:hypothetical protein